MIVRDCLYVRARGLRDREGESYAPGVHRMSDRATRQRVGDARLRKRESESCITCINGIVCGYRGMDRSALKLNRATLAMPSSRVCASAGNANCAQLSHTLPSCAATEKLTAPLKVWKYSVRSLPSPLSAEICSKVKSRRICCHE